jgi:hypothetical protein
MQAIGIKEMSPSAVKCQLKTINLIRANVII